MEAIKCRWCLEPLYYERQPSRILAALLSAVLPGAGQWYKGQFFNGLAWGLMVGALYYHHQPWAVVAHVFCVLGAMCPTDDQS